MKAINYGELILGKNKTGVQVASLVWVNNAKILAAFTVVLGHIVFRFLSNTQNNVDISSWWIANIFVSPLWWCVPVFIMISGLLLLDPRKDEPIIIFYKKRVSKILIPLLFWTIFFLAWRYFLSATNGENLSIGTLIKLALIGEPYYHLWYLYMIIGLYIFTPFIRKLIRHSSDKELLFLCIALFVFSMASTALNSYYSRTDLSPIFTFIYYLPFFLAGYLINTAKTYPPQGLLWGGFILSSIITAAGNYFLTKASGFHTSAYFNNFLCISNVTMSISIMFLLKKFSTPIINSNICSRLALLSFGIYLIHPVIIDILELNGIKPAPDNLILSIPLIAIIVFSISCLIAALINKIPAVKKVI